MRIRNGSVLRLKVPITLSEHYKYGIGTHVTVEHYHAHLDSDGVVKNECVFIKVVTRNGRVLHVHRENEVGPVIRAGRTKRVRQLVSA